MTCANCGRGCPAGQCARTAHAWRILRAQALTLAEALAARIAAAVDASAVAAERARYNADMDAVMEQYRAAVDGKRR